MQTHERNSFITRKSYVFFIIASVCNVLIVQLCSFVNQIFLGQDLGSDAVSALGICTPVYEISTMIPEIISMGAMLMAAKRLAVQDMKSVGKYFTTAMVSTLLICSVLAVALYGWADEAADKYTNDPVLNRYVSEYLPWIGFISVTYGIREVIACFLTLIGKPKFVIMVSVGQFITMIGLDVVFVSYLHMEMVGAAAAQVLSYAISLLVVIPEMRHDRQVFKLYNPFSMWIVRDFMKSLKIGTASGIESLALSVLTLAINTAVLYHYGSNGVFVVTVFLQLLAICTLVTQGAGDTIQTLGTVYKGERDLKGYLILFREVMVLSCIFIFAVEAFILVSPGTLCSLFGATPELIAFSENPLRIISIAMVSYCLLFMMSCHYIALDRLKLSVFVSIGASMSIIIGVYVSYFFMPQYLWHSISIGVTLFVILVFAISFCIAKLKKEEELDCLTLLPKHSELVSVDFSVRYDKKDVTDALMQINKFVSICELPEKLNLRIQSCVEKMMFSIIERSTEEQRQGYFDIRVIELMDSIKVALKDNGTAFNPTKIHCAEQEGSAYDLTMVNSMCQEISYSYANGINCTVMTFR